MPTVLMIEGFRFFFYSKEEERMHIHVIYQDMMAKIWLDTFEVAENYGFKQFHLTYIQKLTRAYEKDLKKAWIKHFG